MSEKKKPAGQQRFDDYWDRQMADSEFQAVYAQEAAKKEVWLQLVEAGLTDGLTQAQMAERLGLSQGRISRIEKRGYDAYTLNTLRRYITALGEGFSLEITIHVPEREDEADALIPS